MNFLNRIGAWLFHPFKVIRTKLSIEQEWQQFKHHIRPHKYKMFLLVTLCCYPVYSPYFPVIQHYCVFQASRFASAVLHKDEPPFQVAENFGKNLIGSILTDDHIKQEALQFVNSLIKDDQFVADILLLLISALKSPEFLASLQGSSKELVLSALNDQPIQEALKKTLIGIVSSEGVKESFIKLIQDSFSSKQAVDTVVSLLAKGIVHQTVQKSLTETISYSVRELLADEETLSQIKIFIFFILRKFENDDEIKGMMDILFAKGLGLTKKKKETELQKIIKNRTKRNEPLANVVI